MAAAAAAVKSNLFTHLASVRRRRQCRRVSSGGGGGCSTRAISCNSKRHNNELSGANGANIASGRQARVVSGRWRALAAADERRKRRHQLAASSQQPIVSSQQPTANWQPAELVALHGQWWWLARAPNKWPALNWPSPVWPLGSRGGRVVWSPELLVIDSNRLIDLCALARL